VQPLVALRRRVDQLRELRRDPLRQSGRTPRNALPRRFDQFGRHFEQLLADARFAVDSPLEGTGFELPVRGCDESGFRACCALDDHQLSKDPDSVA